MVRQTSDAWPNVFRQGELVPAVEYLRAHRLRTIVMREMAQIMGPVDVYVVPSFGGDNELLTNLTGHPRSSCRTASANWTARRRASRSRAAWTTTT